ncbi:MAG: hypothetical protein CSA42_00845 [Gammaproteobacteria bacterium]|nr:MAG: hypothetical protein CSA42_00845 [Gammaproteobacteria bacterium]
MLIDVVKQTDSEIFQQALVEYKKPIIIYDKQLGEMTYDRNLGELKGKVNFLDKQIDFSVNDDVDSDDNQPKADRAIHHLKTFFQSEETSKAWNQKLRKFATEQLIENAKHWQAEKGHTLTADEFYNRIQL